jgi:hypothetical protein
LSNISIFPEMCLLKPGFLQCICIHCISLNVCVVYYTLSFSSHFSA